MFRLVRRQLVGIYRYHLEVHHPRNMISTTPRHNADDGSKPDFRRDIAHLNKDFSYMKPKLDDLDSQKMDDDNTNQKKRKVNVKWKKSYSNVTMGEAQERVGIKVDLLYHNAIPVKTMLDGAQYTLEGLDPDVISKTKEAVYEMLIRYVAVEGYPGDTIGYTESNVNDLVFGIICPIIYDFARQHTGQEAARRLLYLRREKEIISVDKETGGREEFVVIDLIGISAEDNYVLVVEAKRSNLVEAMKQCLLAMYDMWMINGRGVLYGFVTTGQDWRMLTYDGKEFAVTRKFRILFDGFQEKKELWMKDYSIVIDCMYVALRNGGIVDKDMVV